jgi:hypothetical protein
MADGHAGPQERRDDGRHHHAEDDGDRAKNCQRAPNFAHHDITSMGPTTAAGAATRNTTPPRRCR